MILLSLQIKFSPFRSLLLATFPETLLKLLKANFIPSQLLLFAVFLKIVLLLQLNKDIPVVEYEVFKFDTNESLQLTNIACPALEKFAGPR